MKLIMRTEFDNLRKNPLNGYQSDVNGEKQVVKIYRNEQLIAKRITLKKSIRYFAVSGYQQFLTEEVQ
ncbi:hypothetical protein [Colwellia sp. PAMC 21821]|uniref:hypothetical protein n=1 Tax=Colwellia sp. PAMC 21821 TaxID=1816219 RepID=UPI0009BE0DF1|nr:hypothetical protein [Colwellia sp. PAMC 21821]ARD43324.1 hypothetical protein A3Q33_02740 [Colwellia sp. PAMC 21821]